MTTDFETTLPSFDVVDFEAAFDGPAPSKLPINGTDHGLHARRVSGRTFVDGTGEANAAKLIQRLPAPGETTTFLLSGEFVAATVIPTVQKLLGVPVALTCSTLSLSRDNADMLATMLVDGRLCALRLVFSEFFRGGDKGGAEYITRTLHDAGATVACCRVHAKIGLFAPARSRARYTFETSANLRSCLSLETGSLSNDASLFDWHHGWLDKVFQQHSIL